MIMRAWIQFLLRPNSFSREAAALKYAWCHRTQKKIANVKYVILAMLI